MSEAQEQQAGFDSANHASPGQLLRREREHQGLSREEVAVQLNLRPAVIAGLETDQYDEVPIAAYRRGYLRAYARLMGVDERSVIEAYSARHGNSDPEYKVRPVHATRPPSRIGAWIFKLVTLLVIFGLIGLTLLWWQSRNGNEMMDGLGLSESIQVESVDGEPVNAGPDSTVASATDEGGATLPPLPVEDGELGLVDEETPASTQAVETADQGEASMNRPDTAPSTADTPAVAEAPAADEPVTAAEESTATQESAEAETAQATEATTTPPRTDAATGHRLELVFNEQSWTEIHDASGQRVLVGLQSPGTQATAEGEPPFRLTIGNASGVELRYRGDPVDLTAHAGGNNVARFTLGE